MHDTPAMVRLARSVLASAILLMGVASPVTPSAEGALRRHGNASFEVPAGWTTVAEGDGLFLVPPDLTQGFAAIVIGPGSDLAIDFPTGFEWWLQSYLSGVEVSHAALGVPTRTQAGYERRVARLETRTPEDGHVFHLYIATHLPGRLEVVGVMASSEELFDEVGAAFGPFLESLRYSAPTAGQSATVRMLPQAE